jgi:hypothetical protein
MSATVQVWTNDVPAWEPYIPANQFTPHPKDMRFWDGITCKFTRDWVVGVDTPEISFRIVIKAKFLTDGGSIPKFAWGIIAPYGKGILPWFIHDALYATHALPRWLADLVMLRLLGYVGVNCAVRTAAYRMVRIFGGVPYGWCKELPNPATGELIDRWYYVKEGRIVPDIARETVDLLIYRVGPKLQDDFGHLVQPDPFHYPDTDPYKDLWLPATTAHN